MNRFTTLCALAWFLLQSVCGQEWEVINDAKQPGESVTQQELLVQEEFIPFVSPNKKSTPKTYPGSQAQSRQHSAVAPEAPLSMQGRKDARGGRTDFWDEDLMPLGVPRHGRNNRNLLQLSLAQGPSLPETPEQRRLLQKLGLGNLPSVTPCKDSEDEDCLFDVDKFLAQKLVTSRPDTPVQDFDFDESKPVFTELKTALHQTPATRIKRQAANNNNNNNNNDNLAVEGSGTGPDTDLYNRQTSHAAEGRFSLASQIAIPFNADTITPADIERYRNDMEKQLDQVFRNNLPGFAGLVVGNPVLKNGVLVANYTLTMDGSKASASANEVGQTNVEQFMLGRLNNAAKPAFNNIKIFGSPLHSDYQMGAGFASELVTVLDDYCSSENPCPDVGPEYNKSACVNNGFMSGYCPHKCANYPCKNSAVCQLDTSYNPFCSCGNRYTGQFCEQKKDASKAMDEAEKVGVGVAAAVAILAVLSLFGYLLCFRRNSNDIDYSYYEDDGSQERLSDPTSVHSYYIQRPVFSSDPVSVFSPRGTFDV